MGATGESENHLQYLTFHVAGEEYAVGILRVKEIIAYRPTTRVPMTPDYVPGVINLRGNVVPVVDLAAKFGFPPLAVSNRTCIVIVDVNIETDRTVIGIMVEAVNAVIDLDPSDVEATPSFGAGVRTDYLRGMGRIGERFVPILDIDEVLSNDKLLSSIDPANGQEGGPAKEHAIAEDANAGAEQT